MATTPPIRVRVQPALVEVVVRPQPIVLRMDAFQSTPVSLPFAIIASRFSARNATFTYFVGTGLLATVALVSPAELWTFSYDGDGLLAAATNGAITATMTYVNGFLISTVWS